MDQLIQLELTKLRLTVQMQSACIETLTDNLAKSQMREAELAAHIAKSEAAPHKPSA